MIQNNPLDANEQIECCLFYIICIWTHLRLIRYPSVINTSIILLCCTMKVKGGYLGCFLFIKLQNETTLKDIVKNIYCLLVMSVQFYAKSMIFNQNVFWMVLMKSLAEKNTICLMFHWVRIIIWNDASFQNNNFTVILSWPCVCIMCVCNLLHVMSRCVL